ncbi:hypothetical protein BU202_03555 [Streptococcus cuniculi]|uniref:Uncharacterized protein n=1 Tax=Streptococcus cuniculi TaxID=1432788 RepID=A0A1Q8E8G0_9STRE|nr:hypothetical protein [Streptococcus cuniculi]OLF48081.1 hypothetical protein BU202_03555 [Streptococcus cuniculi]
MENQQLDPLATMVETNKKKRKRVLKIVFGVIGGLFLVAAVAGFLFYRNGNIAGDWENPNLAAEIRKSAIQEIGNGFEGLKLDPEEVVGETGVTFEVKDNKAVATTYSTINKEAFLTAFDKAIQEEYTKVVTEAEKEAQKYGISKEDLLKEAFGENYEAEIKKSFPKREEIEKQFDDMMTKEVADTSKGQYDSATGKFSAVYFEGEVSPLTHTIKVTKVNTGSAFASAASSFKVGDVLLYTHNGDTLTFVGAEEYPFKAMK